MLVDVQRKRLENELANLEKCNVPKNLIQVSEDEYFCEVNFHGAKIHKHLDSDIVFMVHIMPHFPFRAPKVYCKTRFCFPSISDYRDLLESIIEKSWQPSYRIVDVIEKIPAFLKRIVTSLQNGNVDIVGRYYLGDKYDNRILEKLPLYVSQVKERLFIDGKEQLFERYLIISDMFLCLFEPDAWNSNLLTLIFWTNLKSLLTIRKVIEGQTVKFFWRQRHKKKENTHIMELEADNPTEVVKLILDKMEKFGVNYKITKPNEKKVPAPCHSIDIESVEKAIGEQESKIESKDRNNLNEAEIEYLMDLYSKAVEFYSAENNPKFEFYKDKIHLTITRLNDYLERKAKESHSIGVQHVTDLEFKAENQDESLKVAEKPDHIEVEYKSHNHHANHIDQQTSVKVSTDEDKEITSLPLSQKEKHIEDIEPPQDILEVDSKNMGIKMDDDDEDEKVSDDEDGEGNEEGDD